MSCCGSDQSRRANKIIISRRPASFLQGFDPFPAVKSCDHLTPDFTLTDLLTSMLGLEVDGTKIIDASANQNRPIPILLNFTFTEIGFHFRQMPR